ncbi:MAG: PspA/IM30 family protein [Planctomycetaceae bacterium]|nr:PspA/IM30 family protein [Planctomycetaceae bacterium]
MKWIDSFTFVMRSSLTALREKVEDPERMLHQLICDMDEELEAVRASVAETLADEIELAKQIEEAHRQSDHWATRTETALRRQDDVAAKQALEQKLKLEDRVATLQEAYESQQEQTARLQAAYRDLEDKIRQARHKRTILIARLSRAQSASRINNALDRAEGPSAFAEFNRLERRVARAEALGDAYERLEGRDPDAAALDAKFAADERRERLQTEFAALKQRMSEEAT